MCTTEIWTYPECGCHYHHPIPCHPVFASSPPKSPSRSILAAIPDTPPDSPASPITIAASQLSLEVLRHYPSLRLYQADRQCSVQHTVHRQFLEPICDDCLLEELGLQPELGPILNGVDCQGRLRGESWLLESNVEIKIEEEDEGIEDIDGDEADDESEPRGRTRRRGMDISRESFRISSRLPPAEQDCLRSFRNELRGEEPEALRQVKMAAKASQEAMGWDRPRSSWSDHVRDGLAVITRRKGKEQLRAPDNNDAPLVSDLSFPERLLLPKPAVAEGLDQSWEDHLKADLETRKQMRDSKSEALGSGTTAELQQGDPALPHSDPAQRIPSSPHTASIFSEQLRSLSEIPLLHEHEALNIPSSEFEKCSAISDMSLSNTHLHNYLDSQARLAQDSIESITSFQTAHSRTPSTNSSPTETTRPTTANPPSLHPLNTPFSITTQQRTSLGTPERSTSFFSPQASSTLLHSTPPLHQSPTSAFVCMHDKWAFTGCGCGVKKGEELCLGGD